MSTPIAYRKVIFIDAQPNPDETGPSRLTFDLGETKVPRPGWSITREGEMVVVRDGAGHEMEVPYVRVVRAWRQIA